MFFDEIFDKVNEFLLSRYQNSLIEILNFVAPMVRCIFCILYCILSYYLLFDSPYFGNIEKNALEITWFVSNVMTGMQNITN